MLLGGAAGVFVGPDDLDVPLTFEGTRAIGATLGSGVVMVFDEHVDLLDIVRRIAEFFRDESCGQCVPCRVGTVRQEELLRAAARRRRRGRRGAGAAARSRPGDARRLHLRPGPDGLERHRIGAGATGARRTARMTPAPIWFEGPPPPSRPPMAPERPALPPVEVVIDGEPAKVPAGATILEACRARGLDIPTLCFLETLTPVNVCRVCVVEVTGSRVLVPACSRRVEPGMTIHTDSERVRLSRRMVLELLASSVDLSTAPGVDRADDPLRRPPRPLRLARRGRGPGRA